MRAEKAVKRDSGSSRQTPSWLKKRRMSSLLSAGTLSSKHRANTPLPTSAGVLGMQRTTGQRPATAACKRAMLMPAATEITTVSGPNSGAISASRASIW